MALTGSQKAYKYALSNVARSGATRSGYVGGGAFIAIGGLPAQGDVKLGTLEIVDELNETPNTCRFRIIGPTSITTGQEVIITLGSQNGLRLFAGHVLDVQQSYWQKPVNVRSDIAAVDYTWQFGFPKVTKRYANLSASAIVQDLIATYGAPNGFTGANVAADLPTIPEITFTNEDLGDAVSRTMNRIGGYWYVDYFRDVHAFFTDTAQPPSPLVPTHPSLDDVRRETDRSQALTRVYVEGRGSKLLSAVDIGDTLIPLEAIDMFEAGLSDVFLKASFQGAEGGAQHLSFTGVTPGRQGSLVGPGMTPGSPPGLATVVGTGMGAGVYQYAYSDVTAAGESLPSPVGTITTGLKPIYLAPPPAPVFDTYFGGGLPMPLGTYQWAMTGLTAAGETTGSATVSFTRTITTAYPRFALPAGPAGTVTRKIYRTDANGAQLRFVATVPDNTHMKLYADPQPDPTPGPTIPTTNTAQNGTAVQQQVTLSAIAIGPPATTARKVYRTAVNAAQLKLLAILFDNTTTTLTDTLADGSLGANPPTSDTSGLQQPAGQVNPGATAVPVASTGFALATGGWAVVGNGEQVLRYQAISGNTLTGIPASGIGAITASIAYNSTITAAPMLTGIPASGPRSISTRALTAGDEIYLVVQCDNTAAQTQLALAVGGTGIREEWVQDRRLSIGEARARGNATLAERVLDQIRVSYTSRDLLTRSGLDIVANLPAPTNLVGTFKIQHVVINNFRPYPTQYPTFTVQASSSRFSFEDLLRLATRDVAR